MFITDTIRNIRRTILLGFKIKSTLGGVTIDVIQNKNEQNTAEVTNRRVEKGFNISDNSTVAPLVLNFRIVDNSVEYLANRIELKRMYNAKDPIDFVYSGRDIYDNVVITDLIEVEDGSQAFGFTYDIALQQITVTNVKDTDVKMNNKKARISGGGTISKTAGTTKINDSDARKAKSFLSQITGG